MTAEVAGILFLMFVRLLLNRILEELLDYGSGFGCRNVVYGDIKQCAQ